ncbi:hypothetical protein EDB81DRAFT_435889 [Dactylonectria macrodidyma]|uniref:PaxU n=1 Tax=Dactylonectria macrodidyma TaxID=307937 RepID=A0A9P9F5V3_9HYPO|nr:hypothetical protein EDB81DRAFT_435889 [Dactylonectria macrodidyma]
MHTKSAPIPGFIALSDQILVQEARDDAERPADHPDAVLIYGWGDCLPKHVAKYADGYRELFPYSTQIVILAPISKAFFSDLPTRTASMQPVLKALDGVKAAIGRTPTVLVHAMSNTGGTNYASTLNAFKLRYDEPLPHQLLVLDSTPGSPNLSWANLKRWSRAMTLGTAAWFPWPFFVTQGIWASTLLVTIAYGWMMGTEAPAAFSMRAIDDGTFEDQSSRRLYLYSKEDDLIFFQDIESYRAAATQNGVKTDAEVFEGSGHVGHMRTFPEKYWNAIQESWERAVGDAKDTKQ